MAFEPLYGIIPKLLRRALRLPQVSPQMACNAVALWVFLDTVYPECEFQSSMVPISENPSFIILIQEAEIAVGHLMAQDSVLPANEIDQVLLLATRIVFPNKKFEPLPLYVKEFTWERLHLWVTICQSFCKDLQPRPHQEVQDEMSDQEDEGGIGDVDDRTLMINFTLRDPVPRADINKYITRYKLFSTQVSSVLKYSLYLK